MVPRVGDGDPSFPVHPRHTKVSCRKAPISICMSNLEAIQEELSLLFDFIECFTTTFLRAHSWLNWVDEDDDEVLA